MVSDTVSHYRILEKLGAGGMGVVYKAEDTRLHRFVALKFLPESIARDTQSRARFEREARTISSLSHPNICTLYDIGHQDGSDYLVMEFLEGRTLADELVRGPLPLLQALRIAAQVASALDRAHRAGVVHRDLKPGNIMLTKTGAKLLDFGLAKLIVAPSVADNAPTAMTQSHPLTAEGAIVGTFQYMAPEQLEGRGADAHTDIFAAGAVLYEMITGQRAFEGRTQASVIASVLTSEPKPISTLQPLAPPALEKLVHACLAKDPHERWQTAHDLKLQIEAIADLGSQAEVPTLPPARGRYEQPLLWALAAVLFVAGAVAGWLGHRPQASSPLRAVLLPPKGSSFDTQKQFAISPDGTRIAFVSAAWRASIFVRRLDSNEEQQLPGTEGAVYPFWSPDSKSIGFFGQGNLKKVDAGGGPVVTLAQAPGARGASWGSGGTIVFAADFGKSGLRMVSAEGGAASSITHIDTARGEDSHRWPFFLPDGRRVLYFTTTGRSAFGANSEDKVVGVYLLDLKTGKQSYVVHADAGAQFANGYLFYLQQQNLIARRFDPSSGQLTGSPQPLVKEVEYNGNFWFGSFSCAENMIAYGTSSPVTSRLVWFDAKGKQGDSVPINGSPYVISISPDGSKVAAAVGEPDGRFDIRAYDLVRGGETRITTDGGSFDPVWTPDGKMITYLSGTAGGLIMNKPSSGLGEATVVVPTEARKAPSSWSPDGKRLLYMNFSGGKGPRTWVHEAGSNDHPLLQTDVVMGEAQFSPDGKWVAYGADETGQYEVYIAPFPSIASQYQVSLEGGSQPRWSHDGKRLYFIAGDKRLVVVDASTTGDKLKLGSPRPLFQTKIIKVFEAYVQYDVAPDEQHFLINTRTDDDQQPIVLFANWAQALEH